MSSRREFITLIGSAASAWPLAAHAQQQTLWRVGYLSLASERNKTFVSAFVDGLRERGYAEGKNVDVDYRFADGDTARLAPLARELISLKPDVLVGGEPSAARALKTIAAMLPIVCPLLGESVLPEFAASYARPGGTVTGIAFNVEKMTGKLMELALEFVPTARRIGLLLNPTAPSTPGDARETAEAASARHIVVLTEEVTTLVVLLLRSIV
jgi:putative ABC transport system substrate-binding protein